MRHIKSVVLLFWNRNLTVLPLYCRAMLFPTFLSSSPSPNSAAPAACLTPPVGDGSHILLFWEEATGSRVSLLATSTVFSLRCHCLRESRWWSRKWLGSIVRSSVSDLTMCYLLFKSVIPRIVWYLRQSLKMDLRETMGVRHLCLRPQTVAE